MIVKVQLSIVSSAGERRFLLYSKDRGVLVEDLSDRTFLNKDTMRTVRDIVKDRLKSFYEVTLEGDGSLTFHHEVPDPGW